jgi:hypothetical protein
MKNRLLILFSIFVTVLTLVCEACGGGATSVSTAQTARLRVINGSWYVPGSMNVVVDGTTVASNIAYPTCVNEVCQTLSPYVSVKSGGVDFAVQAAGSTTNLVPQFQKLNLAPNTQNTLIVVGTVSGIPAGGYLFLDDDVPVANSVKLRIAHAYPSFPGALAAFVLPDGTAPSGTPTISNVMLGSASSYLTLNPGSYDETFAVGCFTGSNCIGVGPITFSGNLNVTVYLLNQGSSHRPLVLQDN